MTEFTQDLNKLERTMLRRGYNFAMTDMIAAITDMVNSAKLSVEEMRVLMDLSKRMDAMESVRFPEENKN